MLMLARNVFLQYPRGGGGATGPAPTYFAKGAINSLAGGELAVDYYASLAANDIAFIWVVCAGVSPPTITPPSGFTGLTGVNFGGVSSAKLMWKRLTGGEAGSANVTFGGGATFGNGIMIGIRGAVTTGTPYEGANTSTGTANPSVSPSIITTGANRLALRFQSNNTPASGLTAASPPTGYTEIADNGGSANDRTITIDYKTLASAGTESASTRADDTGEAYLIQTLAVLPT